MGFANGKVMWLCRAFLNTHWYSVSRLMDEKENARSSEQEYALLGLDGDLFRIVLGYLLSPSEAYALRPWNHFLNSLSSASSEKKAIITSVKRGWIEPLRMM